MHATYYFLLNLDPGEHEKPTDDEWVGEARMEFEHRYAHDRCDENNWYQEEVLILPDGHVVQMCDEGDWRGRDGWYKEYLEVPKEKRWAKVLHDAWVSTAYDLELRGTTALGLAQGDEEAKIADLSSEEIQKAIQDEIPKWLAEQYLKPQKEAEDGKFDLDRWRRKKTARGFESLQTADTPPFSTDIVTPYEIVRCMDLTWGEEIGGILLVDIHT
jgi:hypothetical protein